MKTPDPATQLKIRIKAKSIMATAKALTEEENPSWQSLAMLLHLDAIAIAEMLNPRE